jgi:hypothetical protein
MAQFCEPSQTNGLDPDRWSLEAAQLSRRSNNQGCQMVYILAYQNCHFEKILVGLGMENIGICIGHFVLLYCHFGIFYSHSAFCVAIRYIFLVWVSCTKKNLATPGSSRV